MNHFFLICVLTTKLHVPTLKQTRMKWNVEKLQGNRKEIYAISSKINKEHIALLLSFFNWNIIRISPRHTTNSPTLWRIVNLVIMFDFTPNFQLCAMCGRKDENSWPVFFLYFLCWQFESLKLLSDISKDSKWKSKRKVCAFWLLDGPFEKEFGRCGRGNAWRLFSMVRHYLYFIFYSANHP